MENNGYTDKELIEIITDLKVEMATMRVEMTNTTKAIKKYNGLREAQDGLIARVTAIETCLSEKKETKKDYQWVIALIIGVIMGLLSKFL